MSVLTQQPLSIGETGSEPCASIIISEVIDDSGERHALSRFGDDVWELWPFFTQSNVTPSHKRIDWSCVPADFREVSKAVIYRYWRVGLPGRPRPTARTMASSVWHLAVFFGYLERLGILSLSQVQQIHLSNFVHERKTVDRVKAGTLAHNLLAVELLYRFGDQHADRLAFPPWPGLSAAAVAGWTGKAARQSGKTPLIPPLVLQTLYLHAERLLDRADVLLDERDTGMRSAYKDPEVILLRHACFFMLGVLTGMRCEEIVGIELGAGSTEHKDGITYHWVVSIEHKTKKGRVQYLMPSIGHRILQVMERWSAPLRRLLEQRLALWEADTCPSDRHDRLRRISEARADRRRLFLGRGSHDDSVRAISGVACRGCMRVFARSAGIDWALAPHQLRRVYAWTFVRHRLGNLLFLKEQFKHSSIEMTQLYAANPMQDETLYDELLEEIDTHKVELIQGWMSEDVPLSGGGGRRIAAIRAHNYPNRKALIEETADWISIRSTGHSWCLAQDEGCGGQGLYEPTRCTSCNDAVIDSAFALAWSEIYAHQEELLTEANDLGAGAMCRVQRDLRKSREVLSDLGVKLYGDPDGYKANIKE
ncbi:tyrosine-type recombinase/integrase [Caballeronia sp. LjRoot31]|uniref:tyrosine-type recombinase/integrase n=1 Tax=Caballeronia sp. LjRoot31 TaxID=3342324 RepID=UPI003F4F6036